MSMNRRPTRRYVPVEICPLQPLEISKKATDPWSKMLLKQPLLRARCRCKASAGQARHYFAKDGGVIFRFVLLFVAHDSEHAQIVAQPCQRALVEKAGEIVGAVRQQFASADTDEQLEKFALKEFAVGFFRSSRQCRVRGSELRRIAANSGQRLEQRRIWRAPQQRSKQCVFFHACDVDVVDARMALGWRFIRCGSIWRRSERCRKAAEGRDRPCVPAQEHRRQSAPLFQLPDCSS